MGCSRYTPSRTYVETIKYFEVIFSFFFLVVKNYIGAERTNVTPDVLAMLAMTSSVLFG